MPNTKQKRLEQIPEKEFNRLYGYHDCGVVENRETRRMQQGSIKSRYAHELKLVQAAEQEARNASKEASTNLTEMRHLLALVGDLLPWRDFTALLPPSKAHMFANAIVVHKIHQGSTYYDAVATIDMWWNCPTCKYDINAGPEGEHVYCEYAHTP